MTCDSSVAFPLIANDNINAIFESNHYDVLMKDNGTLIFDRKMILGLVSFAQSLLLFYEFEIQIFKIRYFINHDKTHDALCNF